jgi:hypothetical protein
MTAESGADDPTVQQNQGTDLGSDEAGTPSSRRPVAKTILEGQIPQLLDDGQSGAKIDSSETSINSSPNEETSSSTDLNQTGRKVAKTMIEVTRPTAEQIAQATAEAPTSTKSVAKTKLEMSRPNVSEADTAKSLPITLDAQPASIEPGPIEPVRTVAKTMMEVSRPDLSKINQTPAARPPERSETDRSVPKTMLEINRPKIPKTMMELSLPSRSDTAKQVIKLKRTMLDVDTLDAIGIANAMKNVRANVPVKVRKSLTQDREVLKQLDNAGDTVATNSEQTLDKTVKSDDTRTIPAQKPARSERFVAKTLLDHSVLSEQVVKSAEKERMRAAYIAQEKANDPVKEFHEIDSKKLASPCAFTWAESGGKQGRVRACSTCQTQVYDFSGMEFPEAEALIFKQESLKKFTLHKRADGKFMTKNCPVQAQRKRNFVLLCVIGAIVMICAVAMMLMMPSPPNTQAPGMVPTPGAKQTSTTTSTTTPTTTLPGSAPNKNADGWVHFEAGQPVQQLPASNSIIPTVIGGEGGSSSQKANPPSTTTPGTTTAMPTPARTTTTTTSTGDADSKYWDSGK